MLRLNLPKPSSDLLAALTNTIDQELPNYTPGYEYLRAGVADGAYFATDIVDIGKKEYQHLFDEDINIFAMMLRPEPWITTSTDYITSYYRPHSDAYRKLGLNYILDTGGNNVTTTMYTKVDNSDSPLASVCDYEDVTALRSYNLHENVWYGLEASRYHSVDNIQTPRLLLTISFAELSYTDFIIKYSHFIDSIV